MSKNNKSKELHTSILSHLEMLMKEKGYHIQDIPPVLRCDLILRKEKIIYLIELKIGNHSRPLPYGFYSNLIQLKRQAESYFARLKCIVDIVLVSNYIITGHMMRLYAPNINPIIIETQAKKPKSTAEEVANKLIRITERTINLQQESFMDLKTAKNVNERLRALQKIGQLVELLDEKQIEEIIEQNGNDPHPAIRGEVAYLLGRSKKSDWSKVLVGLSYDKNQYVRRQATKALSMLRG